MVGFIDVWDIESFDRELVDELHANSDLVHRYIATDREILLEREVSETRGLYRENPYAANYYRFLEELGRHLEARTIRAWHYTRLTGSEVEALQTAGTQLSTLKAIRERLDAQVASGQITVDIANALFEASPFHDKEQAGGRSNRFWMRSHPVGVDDGAVRLLVNNWGGEAVYFWLQDPRLKHIVAAIGKARVLEVRVPLDATHHAHCAAKAVVATFVQSTGGAPYFEAFDLCAIRALGPEAILAVHTEGEVTFNRVGRGYPISFRTKMAT